MACDEIRALLGAYSDNELTLSESARVNFHLGSCQACREKLKVLSDLHEKMQSPDLVFNLPAGLESKIFSKGLGWKRWFLAPRPVALATAVVLIVLMVGRWDLLLGPSGQIMATEVVSEHLRAMKSEHLVDVVSTDQHTVKPWFNGKIDFSPNVKDLAAEGYPLVGGRVDYLGGRSVAAIVFKRRQHVINMFIWPDESHKLFDARAFSIKGFNVLKTHKEGFVYWIVSDLNSNELGEFMQLYNK